MKLAGIQFLDVGLRTAAVRLTPSWWERLLGRDETDFAVVAVPATGGSVVWLHDSVHAVRVPPWLAAALERARHDFERRLIENVLAVRKAMRRDERLSL